VTYWEGSELSRKIRFGIQSLSISISTRHSIFPLPSLHDNESINLRYGECMDQVAPRRKVSPNQATLRPPHCILLLPLNKPLQLADIEGETDESWYW
jgi:hypothetical protein